MSKSPDAATIVAAHLHVALTKLPVTVPAAGVISMLLSSIISLVGEPTNPDPLLLIAVAVAIFPDAESQAELTKLSENTKDTYPLLPETLGR